MARLHERLVAHSRIQASKLDPETARVFVMVRKSLEECKEIFRLLEDLLGALGIQLGNQPGTTNIFNNFGVPARDFSYPNVIDASSHIIPNGLVLSTTNSVRITRCELQFDPAIPATTATTFTLQNQSSSPTSTGGVTVPLGATYVNKTGLGVIVGLGQSLWLKAPSNLNDLQRLNWGHVEFERL